MKKKMIPKREHHTMHPARQRNMNMKMNDIRIAHPSAAISHFQLLIISVIKLLRSPCLKALVVVVLTLLNAVVNITELGTQRRPITK